SYGEQKLTILHTSEHHGSLLPIESPGETKVGGMAARAALIAAIRRETDGLLLVDSGDILIGTTLSSFFRGEPDIGAMNLMGYQAMAAGNHEFDFGLDHLRRLGKQAQLPILCSNLMTRGPELPCHASSVVRVGRLSIGLIGLLGRRNFPDMVHREAAKALELHDPIETARALARSLKENQQVDLVVAITHEETDEDMLLLAEAPEVDVIIGGHTPGFDGLRSSSATGTAAEQEPSSRVFVKTHRQGRTIGRLDLVIGEQAEGTHRKIRSAKARNVLVTDGIPTDPTVQALIESYTQKLEEQAGTVVGRSMVTLDGENSRIRSSETNLGSLLADLMRAKFGTDVALLNSGQIRDSIPLGPVNLKRILKVLPFPSSLITFIVTGQQLLSALENSVSLLPATHGRFLQVSGLAISYDLAAPPGSRVRQVIVGQRPLDASRPYSVTTDVFLADGGDGYTMFAKAEDRVERQLTLRDLLLEAMSTSPLSVCEEGRIRYVR
ncbi:MAG: bifunctional metallophosphatase/5'-nucleotidase, partial [Nitrospiraceae bacterium]